VKVAVTLTVRNKTVPIEQVNDRRLTAPFEAAGRQIGQKLDRVRCPTHKKAPLNVRVHFDASGAADLRYDSCCAELGNAVTRALG
jgi:hypothetical protein